MSTSQNGWPALPPSSNLLHTWVIPAPSGTTKLRLRGGSAGFLLCHLALWFDDAVEDLMEPVLDDWGFAFRAVRGFETTLSNHASGTAMDLNATDHPLGLTGTFTQHEIDLIHKRLRLYRGVIRWGGDYQNRKDAMHFEVNDDLREAERVARRLINSPRGKRLLRANPGQKAVILS